MKKLVKNKNLWIFILSLITTICISVNTINGAFTFHGNDFKWILMVAIFCLLFSKAIEKYNKRLFICSRNL